jgi:hypothetical protein
MSLLSVAENINHRHCEERSNRELYRASMQAPLYLGDCFVPRNDG